MRTSTAQMYGRLITRCVAVAIAAGAFMPNAHAAPPKPPSMKLEFNRDIRPILSDNCFACHGPNKTARQAGLRLDEKETALQLRALVPGKPDKSGLIDRIYGKNGPIMPPPSSHKTLTATQKELLKRWVEQGAPYQVFWAYAPISRPATPLIRSTPRFAIRGPIDAFILQKLNQKGISPSKEADRRTLIRRISLDLVGLPPTPAEVGAFLADNSPGAYERLVYRLLKSPHYGERMALPWLDAVRYADTVGFHGDQNMNSWAYRDYVIDSFNRNKPFNKFTVEQIAGDLLPNPTPEQLTATCFNRLNMVTREGGAQDKEYLAKYQADRVRTVSLAWLGSTFACAECHDHKYDPISTRDFYSLGCFFADMRQWGVYEDYGYTPNPELKGSTNDSPFPPEINVRSPYLVQRIAKQRARIGEIAEKAIKISTSARADLAAWITSSNAFLKSHPDGWDLQAPAITVTGRNAKGMLDKASPVPGCSLQADSSVLLTDEHPGDLTLSIHSQSLWLASLKLELLPSAAGKVFRKGRDAADVTLAVVVLHADGTKTAVTFRYAGANLWEPQYSNGYDQIGVQRGWRPSIAHAAEQHISTWFPARPIRLATGDTIAATLPKIDVACVRLSVSPFVPEHAGSPKLPATLALDLDRQLSSGTRLASTASGEIATASQVVVAQYLVGTAWDPAAFKQATALEAEIFSCREGITPVMVTEAKREPLVMRILARGNWQDETGAIVEPAVPHFLSSSSVPKGRRLTRLDLANWLVSNENPLTSRTYVNRLWKLFFGNAISGQVEDLGAQGEWPTHPEMLDWLAFEFRSSGWDVKHMVRLMVTSSTYRQDARLRPEPHDIDPGNRLLASQNPRRLEAELVRDNALSIAGALTPDIGGPPCFPYQPEGYYANIQFPDRNYIANTDDRQYRRGVYMHWQRTFLHPMLANFDAPSREDCTATRPNANTPQQALTLLNDPEFVEAAKLCAVNLLAGKSTTDASRIELLFQRALSRSPKSDEKRSLSTFLSAVRSAYKERPEDAAKLLSIGVSAVPTGDDKVELAAWTSVCRVVLNLHETITRY